MKSENYIKLEFPSQSVNEGFARAAAAAFAAQERSGMGFTIMESFMDKLRVRSAPGRGTTVTMIRSIKPRSAAR